MTATLPMSDLFIVKGVCSMVAPRLVRKCTAYEMSACEIRRERAPSKAGSVESGLRQEMICRRRQ